MFTGILERAILEALAYSDVFDYPLHLDELHRYLTVRAEVEDISQALNTLTKSAGKKNDFYFLLGREAIVEIREQREAHSKRLLSYALRYGRILGSLPFIRMVALTGSLAVLNSSKGADFDYMLVTAPNRVWIARAFALLLNRFTRLFGHTICPNLIVSEDELAWSQHDLYSAHELAQMIPIKGMEVYQRLMKENEWVKGFLPNAFSSLRGATERSDEAISSTVLGIVSSGFAFLAMTLSGKLGDRLEQWEMNRKIARFSKQEGFGEETVFNADVCQGNFDHHHKKTKEIFEGKLSLLQNDSPLSVEDGLRVRVE